MALTNKYLEVAFGAGYTGLTGTVGYALMSNAGAVVVARTTTGVFEQAGGTYGVIVPTIADTVATIEWDTGGGTPVYAHEDMSPYLNRGEILADTSDMQPRVVAVEVDTNEMQGKLPTNFIMGSGVVTDKDDEIDAILADTAAMQPTIATNLDATVSSRATQSDILSDATPFAGANIDATISSRSDFDETTDPVELLDTGGAAGTSAAELVTDIGTDLTASHGAGSWAGVATAPQVIRDAMKLAPTAGAAAVGSVDEQLDEILTDTASIDARLPSAPADEILQQAAHAQTQADIAALNDLDATAVENAVWDATQASHVGAGTTGKSLNDAGGAGAPPTVSDIVDGVWDDDLTARVVVNSAGKTLKDTKDRIG